MRRTLAAVVIGLVVGGLALLCPASSNAGRPADWRVIVENNGSLSTFPKNYTMDGKLSKMVAYQIVYTYGGTGTVTVKEQCTIDGTNWFTLATPVNASGADVDVLDYFGKIDVVTVKHIEAPCWQMRLNFTAAGGSPSLTGLYVSYFRHD